jgi:endoplasmic reticulum junction formation protein lunapark
VFDWRINRQQSHVEALQKQRESKINDLKKATKYDSTQELLQKYGGGPPKEQTPSKKGGKKQDSPKQRAQQQQQQQQRTGLPPPPTANIPRPHSPQARPQIQPSSQPGSPSQMVNSPATFSPDAPGFAPNAFSVPPPSAPPAYQQQQGPNWYDRILDVMLGEDETAAKNRLALICSNCRLVNGQAPPGVRTLEELGRWRCSACGSWNGVDARKAAREVVETVRREGGGVVDEEDSGWEEVAKTQNEGTEVEMEEVEGTTGREAAGGADGGTEGVSMRVTRSMVAEGDS